MKKISYLLVIVCLIAFYACRNTTKIEEAKQHIKLHAFTDIVKLDTFKIILKGETSKNMKLLFTITSYKGLKIYEKEIKAEELLKNYISSADITSETKKVKFLTDEVNYFFEEENFIVPAVISSENPDKNVPDKEFFQELKQSQLNGFSYRLSKDVSIYLAWSEQQQQVKIYYKCC